MSSNNEKKGNFLSNSLNKLKSYVNIKNVLAALGVGAAVLAAGTAYAAPPRLVELKKLGEGKYQATFNCDSVDSRAQSAYLQIDHSTLAYDNEIEKKGNRTLEFDYNGDINSIVFETATVDRMHSDGTTMPEKGKMKGGKVLATGKYAQSLNKEIIRSDRLTLNGSKLREIVQKAEDDYNNNTTSNKVPELRRKYAPQISADGNIKDGKLIINYQITTRNDDLVRMNILASANPGGPYKVVDTVSFPGIQQRVKNTYSCNISKIRSAAGKNNVAYVGIEAVDNKTNATVMGPKVTLEQIASRAYGDKAEMTLKYGQDRNNNNDANVHSSENMHLINVDAEYQKDFASWVAKLAAEYEHGSMIGEGAKIKARDKEGNEVDIGEVKGMSNGTININISAIKKLPKDFGINGGAGHKSSKVNGQEEYADANGNVYNTFDYGISSGEKSLDLGLIRNTGKWEAGYTATFGWGNETIDGVDNYFDMNERGEIRPVDQPITIERTTKRNAHSIGGKYNVDNKYISSIAGQFTYEEIEKTPIKANPSQLKEIMHEKQYNKSLSGTVEFGSIDVGGFGIVPTVTYEHSWKNINNAKRSDSKFYTGIKIPFGKGNLTPRAGSKK